MIVYKYVNKEKIIPVEILDGKMPDSLDIISKLHFTTDEESDEKNWRKLVNTILKRENAEHHLPVVCKKGRVIKINSLKLLVPCIVYPEPYSNWLVCPSVS
jgi:hypothetical protein